MEEEKQVGRTPEFYTAKVVSIVSLPKKAEEQQRL